MITNDSYNAARRAASSCSSRAQRDDRKIKAKRTVVSIFCRLRMRDKRIIRNGPRLRRIRSACKNVFDLSSESLVSVRGVISPTRRAADVRHLLDQNELRARSTRPTKAGNNSALARTPMWDCVLRESARVTDQGVAIDRPLFFGVRRYPEELHARL